MPPEPICSSRRKRPLRRVPITSVLFSARAGPSALFHGPRLLLVVGCGAPGSPFDERVRRLPLVHLGDGRPCPRLYGQAGRLSLAPRALARGGGRDADADRSAAVERGADRVDLPGV